MRRDLDRITKALHLGEQLAGSPAHHLICPLRAITVASGPASESRTSIVAGSRESGIASSRGGVSCVAHVVAPARLIPLGAPILGPPGPVHIAREH
jgi:hypothetical protein